MLTNTELRNQIYDYILEDVTELDKSETDRGSLLISRGKAKKGLGYLALARVNRQIHAEYRSLLLSCTRLAVNAEQLDEFTDTFYPNAKHPGGDIGDYEEGNFAVVVTWEATLDLMPLARLCQSDGFTVTLHSPNMYITAGQNYYISDLNRLMTTLVKMVEKNKIAAELDDSHELFSIATENDDLERQLNNPAFPTPAHVIVRLYTPPPDLGYCEPFKDARIEIVVDQSNVRAWIDGKPLHAYKLTGHYYQRAWEPVEREQQAWDNWDWSSFGKLYGARPQEYEWEVLAKNFLEGLRGGKLRRR
jgi:hypothetical protein